eukprot:4740254-Amphidinium_carterae.3
MSADEERELDNMLDNMGVVVFKKKCDLSNDYTLPRTRWVRQKRGPNKWRSRIVCKDFKFLDPHLDHLHTSGQCHVTARVLDMWASMKGLSRLIGDTTKARAKEKGIDPEVYVPVLARKLYGERDASAEFGDLFTSVLVEKCGLHRCLIQPQFYKNGDGIIVELHQDDLHI